MSQWRDPKEFKRDAIHVIVAVGIVSIILKLLEAFFNGSSEREREIAKNMIEEASQWHSTSMQDQNSQTKTQHSATAAAFLHAARHILNDAGLEQVSGIDVHELDTSIKDIQKASHRDVVRQCPRLKSINTSSLPVNKKSSWAH